MKEFILDASSGVERILAVSAEAVGARYVLHETRALPAGTDPIKSLRVVCPAPAPPVARGHGGPLSLLDDRGCPTFGGPPGVTIPQLALLELALLTTVWVVEIGRLVLPPKEPVFGVRCERVSRVDDHTPGILFAGRCGVRVGFWSQSQRE